MKGPKTQPKGDILGVSIGKDIDLGHGVKLKIETGAVINAEHNDGAGAVFSGEVSTKFGSVSGEYRGFNHSHETSFSIKTPFQAAQNSQSDKWEFSIGPIKAWGNGLLQNLDWYVQSLQSFFSTLSDQYLKPQNYR